MARLIYEPLTDIPIGFTEVEYLQSTNRNCYINTSVFPNLENIKLEIRAIKETGFSLFGSYEASMHFNLTGSGNYNYLRYNGGSTPTYLVSDADKPHTFVADRGSLYVDGELKVSRENSTGTSINSIALFARLGGSNNNQYTDAGNHTIYYCKIWNNGVLVRDFVPCLDLSNVPCLYDKVTGTAFYNRGTGSFTYGRKIIPVEYLESSGTQYIDLGIKGKDGYDFDYKFNSTRIDSTAYGIGGEWESNKSCYLGLIRNTNYFAYHYKDTSSPVEVQLLTANTDYTVQAHLYSGEQYYVINGTKSAVGTLSGTFTSTTSMNLFRVNSSSPLYSYIKVYYLKIKDNGTLVRDMIPCKDENNVGYMFDRVTHTAYLNAGTGSFTYGNTLPTKKMRLIKTAKRDLPYGYTEVEYLQSTGTQYIDTGLASTTGFRGVATLEVTANETAILFGTQLTPGATTSNKNMLFTNGGKFKLGCTTLEYVGSSFSINTKYNVDFSTESSCYLKVDGTTSISETNTDDRSVGNINIFCGTKSGEIGYFAKMKLYCFKMYISNTLVRDFIPVLDNNNVPCMYDKVTGTTFYNAGTGDFVAGRQIKPVEYLQSSGTQYIDTGWTPKSNDLRVKFKVKSMGSPNQKAICGAEKTGIIPRWVFILYGQNANVSKTFPLTGDWNNSTDGFTFTNGTVLDIDWTTSATSTTITDSISNTTYTYTFASSITYSNNDVSLKLFCNSTSQKSSIQMNYYQIWDNGVLVRDFIPCIDENNTPYMFDKVTHSVFLNVGTGSFTYGSELDLKDKVRFIRDDIPNIYKKVEYLESIGAQYIDTGYIIDTSTDEIELYFQITEANNYKWIFGEHDNNARIGLGSGDGENKRNVAYYNSTYKVNDTEMYSSQHYYKADSTGAYLNGTKKANYTAFSSTSTIYLFNLNLSQTDYCCSGKIWSYKHRRNGVLIRDFIPVVRKADNKPGMYDKVTKQFFTNAGTGEFTIPSN